MPMLRALFLALLFCFVGATQASAQPKGPCNGLFERVLKGYQVYGNELPNFKVETQLAETCRRSLDLSNPDHLVIDAFIDQSTRLRDWDIPNRQFAAACAKGNRLGCFYAQTYNPTDGRFVDAPQLQQRLRAMLDSNLPIVAVVLGGSLVRPRPGGERDDVQGTRLLRQASDQGDYWATYFLAELDMMATTPTATPSTPRLPSPWLYQAAEQGNLYVAMELGAYHHGRQEYAEALKWFRHAATADPRWFRVEIMTAHVELGGMYARGDGVPVDIAQARKHLETARDMGSPWARGYLDKLPKP